jgi:hypothetical protein
MRAAYPLLAALLFITPAFGGPVVLPDGGRIESVDFERHVQGLFGKLGCNAGACHGSFQGKGGLYLSLFGHSPEKDLLAFTRESMGRRISIANPDASLLLLKASGQAPHGGGKRIDVGSWQYHVLREWIAGGAKWTPSTGNVKRLEVTPGELLFAKPGESGRFKVMAEYEDGSKEDVTGFCGVQVSDDYVAEATNATAVRGLRPGDSAVILSYRGNVISGRVLVKVPMRADFVYPKVAEVNLVDREVFAKLRKLNIVPSDLSSDAEFLRRITIDSTGSLPTPEEVRKFLSDPEPQKRGKKIDELPKHPLHAALWATKFSDITGNNVDFMEQSPNRTKKSKMWHDWFRKRIADNVPYDEIVKGVLTATSRDGMELEEWVKQTLTIEQQAAAGWDTDYAQRRSLDLFWKRQRFPIEQMGEHTAAAFLGIRLECAQCHKHPFDRWTQDDYHSYAAIFAPVRLATAADAQQMIAKQQAELRKQQAEALAALDKEYAPKKKPIEEQIEKDFADRKKAAEEKADAEIAVKKKALEAKIANDPPEKRKAAMEKFDRDSVSIHKKHLATVQQEMDAKRRTAMSAIDRELAKKKAEFQTRFRLVPTQFREVTVGTPPTPPRIPNRPAPPQRTPKSLGGPEIKEEKDPRVALFAWMRSGENPQFARSFVNRVWAHYFGRGIVDPVDNFSMANPPSNEKLLDALAKEFVEHHYDIRHIEKLILSSRTYQLSAMPNETNRHDRGNYARSYPRRMMAEAVVDVLNSALGVTENFGPEVQPGIRAIEIATNKLQQNPTLTNVFRLFGRPTRTATCDCERPAEPALPQTLYLMTDAGLLKKVTDGRLKDLLASKMTDEEIIEELMLATLSRMPIERERKRLLEHVQSRTTRQSGFVDVVWALINTREFILNH